MEIGLDATDFASALRSILRQNPDVILVGEMRDLETIQLAMTAAETGHLVMGTLHTSHYRDRWRDELPPRSHAWLFFNMAVATTLRYLEADDPIPLEDLRIGLKLAAGGLLKPTS